MLRYVGASGVLSALPTHLNRISLNLAELNPMPSVDRSGTRIAFDSSAGDFSGIGVFDADLTLLGALPGTTAAVAFSPDPAGPATRAYTVDGCKVRAFDLGLQAAGSFTEITAAPYPIDIGCLGNHPRLLLTPDGHTAILAGDQQIVIVGTP